MLRGRIYQCQKILTHIYSLAIFVSPYPTFFSKICTSNYFQLMLMRFLKVLVTFLYLNLFIYYFGIMHSNILPQISRIVWNQWQKSTNYIMVLYFQQYRLSRELLYITSVNHHITASCSSQSNASNICNTVMVPNCICLWKSSSKLQICFPYPFVFYHQISSSDLCSDTLI